MKLNTMTMYDDKIIIIITYYLIDMKIWTNFKLYIDNLLWVVWQYKYCNYFCSTAGKIFKCIKIDYLIINISSSLPKKIIISTFSTS